MWWLWRSWLARQIVALEAEGSNPSSHPTKRERTLCKIKFAFSYIGLSPSGKAWDFDSHIVGSTPASPTKSTAPRKGSGAFLHKGRSRSQTWGMGGEVRLRGRVARSSGVCARAQDPNVPARPIKNHLSGKGRGDFCSYSVKKALQHHQQGADTDQQAADGRFGRDLLVQEHCGQNQRDHDAQLVNGHHLAGRAGLQRAVIAQPGSAGG